MNTNGQIVTAPFRCTCGPPVDRLKLYLIGRMWSALIEHRAILSQVAMPAPGMSEFDQTLNLSY